MFIFDTDIIIWILRGKKEIVEAASLIKEKGAISLSTITIAEIYKNIFPSEIITTDDLLFSHNLINIDDKIAKQAGLYWQEHIKFVNRLSIVDCIIASTAYINNLILVTLNTKHFPMKEIQVITPHEFN